MTSCKNRVEIGINQFMKMNNYLKDSQPISFHKFRRLRVGLFQELLIEPNPYQFSLVMMFGEGGKRRSKKIKRKMGHFQSYLTRQKCQKAIQLFDLNVPLRHIVRELQIAQKTIRKIKNEYLFTGSIQPYKGYMKRYGPTLKDMKQDQVAKNAVQKLLKQNCSHTMGSLKRALQGLGINKQIPTLYKYLHELKYSRKKIRKVQLERNTRQKLLYRQKYCQMISKIPIENQIFLDQTTFYQNTAKQFGWAPRGQSAYIHIPANQKKHVTLLAAISVRGFEATKIIVGKFRCKHILEFIEHYLDHIQPHEVLVLDNARYHHSVLVKQKLQQLNRSVRYLPAYSPQLNPIQRVFGSIKRRFKKWRSLVEISVPQMNQLIQKTVQDVATKDFRQYFDEYQEWIKKGVQGQLFV